MEGDGAAHVLWRLPAVIGVGHARGQRRIDQDPVPAWRLRPVVIGEDAVPLAAGMIAEDTVHRRRKRGVGLVLADRAPALRQIEPG